jgi:SEC-C motif-containing protein
MSTAAQIAANTINAQSSTGPRTEAGLAESSKNAINHGLFAQCDFIRPGEEEVYAQAKTELTDSLAPSGPLECNLANEIHRAMWRLRRCGQVEATIVIGLDNGNGVIFDPMEMASATADKVQRSVDRARSQSHRLLHKCTAELRKLQTERQFRNEHFVAGTDVSDLGISSYQSVRNNIDKQAAAQDRLELARLRVAFNPACPPPAESGSFCKTEKSQPPTPRNAPCPCQSGEKYKRCCGKDAPPMLGFARQAA